MFTQLNPPLPVFVLEKGNGYALAVIDYFENETNYAEKADLQLIEVVEHILRESAHFELLNKAVNGAYAPGSTFKPVVAMAALEAGILDPNATVFCPGFNHIGPIVSPPNRHPVHRRPPSMRHSPFSRAARIVYRNAFVEMEQVGFRRCPERFRVGIGNANSGSGR